MIIFNFVKKKNTSQIKITIKDKYKLYSISFKWLEQVYNILPKTEAYCYILLIYLYNIV